MACKYYYKGHEFASELELDEFLLERLPLEAELGDMVFSTNSTIQLNTISRLSEINKEAFKLKELYNEILKNAQYTEDGEPIINKPPYIGVNKYLSSLEIDGKLLFPEFREKEYWARRRKAWKEGQFTEAELEEFNITNPEMGKDVGKHDAWEKQMTERWKNQGKIGDAVHNVLEICFQKTGDDYNFNLSKEDLKNLIQSKVKNKNKKYLTEPIIDQAINYANQLRKDLEYKFGTDLLFFPEFILSQNTNIMQNKEPETLLGIIDLLIVDKTGKLHILDYKTSVHSYLDFGQAKQTAYTYQLATYQRMLAKHGFNVNEGDLIIAPIKIEGFKKESTGKYTYDKIAPHTLVTLNTINRSKLWENIDEFMSVPFEFNLETDQVLSVTSKIMSELAPEYSSVKQVTRENIITLLKKYDALKPNENNQYVWRKNDNEGLIVANTESEFIDKVFKYEQGQPQWRQRNMIQVKKALREAFEHGIKNATFPSPIITQTEGSTTWLQDLLKPYCNGLWEIKDNDVLESFGIITLKTKDGYEPKQIDFIRVSTQNLTDSYRKYIPPTNPFKNRRNLMGQFISDVEEESKSDSLMLSAINGNLELIEMMSVINQIPGLEGYTIGSLKIVNPRFANGIEVSNEQLLYCWSELNKYVSIPIDRISSGAIQFASKYEIVRQKFKAIMTEGEEHQWKDGYSRVQGLRECTSILDENITNKEEQIKALNKLLRDLTTIYSKTNISFDKIYTTEQELQTKEVALYNSILMAIADLRGINFRQQLNNHDPYLENAQIFTKGAEGLYTDNPGNLKSETLNLITKLVQEAYQNVRDDMQREKVDIAKLVKKLKAEKQKGFELSHVPLYENMTYVSSDGDFLFKNPNNLHGAEKEFLEFLLDKINKNRFPQSDLEMMKRNNDPEYYRVPLARGGSDSVVATKGLLSMLKSKLRYLNPKTAYEISRQKLEGLFNASEYTNDQQNSHDLFKMTNLFDEGQDPSKRIELIQRIGIENIEHDLELLLYKHLFAYSVKNNIDGVMPMIKASAVHLGMQGAIQNKVFENDISYLKDYIMNKIHNKSIIDPKLQNLANKIGLIKQAASKLTLAFAPVQALYQPLQGLWVDISLFIRKPDGKTSFTFSHFKDALKLVYSDLTHFSEEPTLCSALNELYAMNDMDMNQYAERISTTKDGFLKWIEQFAFKFSSRPDYYNRLTIFTAQMMGDGCLKAHSIENGKLVYDWKLDKRFEAFANNRVSDPKYREQQSLYYTIAQQFVREGVKNPDGTLFELNMVNPNPLPRAYTSKQAESMKSLADDIYGYYSHEKKSLIMSTFLGSMWLQFKTYWSGKKNQYLQSGGVRLRGSWEKVPNTYYQVDSDGKVRFDLPFTTTPTIASVYQWKGQWQEGIILTLSDLIKTSWQTKSIKEGWNSKWNNTDSNLRLAYRNNIKQFGYDIALWIIGGTIIGGLLGDWLKELKEDNRKNKDFFTGLYIAGANIGVMAVRNSFMDFNAADSVGGVLTSWTPFSLDWGSRTANNLLKVATGDEDIWDGIINTSGALKQVKPVLDTVKPKMFRTKREGGTFGA